MVFPALDYTHVSIFPKQKNQRTLVIFYENTAAVSITVSVQDTTDTSAITTAVPLERMAAMASHPTMAPSLTNTSVEHAVAAPATPAVPAASGYGVTISPVATESPSGLVRDTAAKGTR